MNGSGESRIEKMHGDGCMAVWWENSRGVGPYIDEPEHSDYVHSTLGMGTDIVMASALQERKDYGR